MRIQWISLVLIALFFGALGGAILAPQPANAVNRDMVELQQNVSQLLQNQQDMRSSMDANNATLKTLIQQSMDSVGKMSNQMDSLQKTVQDVQANTGSRIDAMAQQTQGISDNLGDLQSRVGKLSSQLTDMQNLLQSIDAKVSGGGQPSSEPGASPAGQGSSYPQAPATPNGSPSTYNMPNSVPSPYGSASPSSYSSQPHGSPSGAPAGNAMSPGGMAPISADTLYHNALRDYTTGNYDLARQEFTDYIGHFPNSDLASNSQFYLGEIFYAQKDYTNAIKAYNLVLSNYPQSIKLAAALLKKAEAEDALKERPAGIRDLREVVRRFPGSDESRRAKALLQGMGVPSAEPHASTSR